MSAMKTLFRDIESDSLSNLTGTIAVATATTATIDMTPSALSALISATHSTQLAASAAATYISSMLSPSLSTVENSNNAAATYGSTSYTVGTVNGEAYYENLVNYPDDLINNEFVQIFFGILYTTVFVLGVFGNVLVCYVVLRNRAMQTVTNIFITNLALSDILLCTLAVPFTPLYTFMGRWAFGQTLCHLVSFAQGCSIYISTLTLTSIAIDRYFVIIYPFHPRMKLSTCIAIIISIWVIALLATLPYGMYVRVVSEAVFIGNGTHANGTRIYSVSSSTESSKYDALHWSSDTDYVMNDEASALSSSASLSLSTTATEAYMQLMTLTTIASTVDSNNVPTINRSFCEENWPSEQYRKVFGSVTTILQFVLPFVIISICYTWVSIKLNARARAKPGSKSSRREEADRDRKKRTNRMLIAMVAVFGLSWLPLNVVNIFDDFYVKSNEWRFYNFFFFIAHSIAMSSTCYNPFLYAWLNENFRKEFKHVLPCFNPSNNNNILNIARGYNRSERNTCGPRLRHGSECGGLGAGGGGGGDDENDENGITQETTCLPRERLLIIPREPTYGNGSSTVPLSPQRFEGNNINSTTQRNVEISLNESGCGSGAIKSTSRSSRRHNKQSRDELDEVDSGDEQTIEMRFCETPFVSSDNTTAISMLETSISNTTDHSGVGEGSRSGRCN